MSTKPKPYPRTLPPMPKGQVYIGPGLAFTTGGKSFQGYALSPKSNVWRPSSLSSRGFSGKIARLHYCAPADSEVARLNSLAPAKKSPRKAAKKASSKKTPLEWVTTPSWKDEPAPALVLEVGKTYLTRDGREANVACAINADTYTFCIVIKKTGCMDYVTTCMPNGRMNQYNEKDDDLVSEKLDFDWSRLPPWINYIAMDKNAHWAGYGLEPYATCASWIGGNGDKAWCPIPPAYAPTNQPSEWRQSLRVRPGYQPEAK